MPEPYGTVAPQDIPQQPWLRWNAQMQYDAKGRDIIDVGDLSFSGDGSGLAFGEMYVKGNAVASSVTVAGTYYQVLIFTTNGESNDTAPDHTNDHITIERAGRYLVQCECSGYQAGAGANIELHVEIRKNNGATRFDQTHKSRSLPSGGGNIGVWATGGILDLAANDTVEVWFENETSTADVIFEDITLRVLNIGGT